MNKIIRILIIIGIISMFLISFIAVLPVKADKNTYSGDTDDGYLWQSDGDYLTCWGSVNGNAVDGGNSLYIGQRPVLFDFEIYRTVLFFNTSDLDVTLHNISGVNLRFYVFSDESVADFNIVVQEIVCNKPLLDGDYFIDNWNNEFGSVNTGDIQPYDTNYMEIELSQEWIDTRLNYDGYSVIGLRSHYDIAGREPRYSERVVIYSADFGIDRYRPQLRIYYNTVTDFDGNLSDDWLWISGLEFEPPTIVLLLFSLFFWLANKHNDYLLAIMSGILLMSLSMYYFSYFVLMHSIVATALLLGSLYCYGLAFYFAPNFRKE